MLLAKSLDDALAQSATASPPVETVFVIGGAQPIIDALAHPACDTAYITHLHSEFDCDVSLPGVATFGFAQLAAQASLEHLVYVCLCVCVLFIVC